MANNLSVGLILTGVLIGAGVPAAGADQEQARLIAHRAKDVYWQCLAHETVRALPRKMSGSDFEIYIKGRCLDEAKQFRIKMADFLSIAHPEMGTANHISSADWAISKAIEDVASTYVDLNTKAGAR
jgi:hypothetical protein